MTKQSELSRGCVDAAFRLSPTEINDTPGTNETLLAAKHEDESLHVFFKFTARSGSSDDSTDWDLF
jgi:hypothetical protein